MGDFQTAELTGEVGEGFDEYLFYLLHQVANRRNRDFAAPLDALGLNLQLWRAMSTINRLESCLMSELAEFTTVDRTTLTRTVDHLVAEGLVVRRAAVRDRRLVCLELTLHGGEVFRRAVAALKDHNVRALAGLSQEEIRTFRATLQRILANIVPDAVLFEQLLNFSR